MCTRSRCMGKVRLALIFSLALEFPSSALAVSFSNSLWLGTDNTSALAVLNTDRAGVVLRQVDSTEATGIAADLAANRIYFSTSAGQLTGRDLDDPATPLATFNPPTVFSEDLAFDGTSLWRNDISGLAVQQIDPGTGNITFSFNPGFSPLGLAWDGTFLWVGQFAGNGLVKQFTTAGVATGNQFNAPLGGLTAGGLAFDTTDDTFWIGTFNQVFHTSMTGTLLGSFSASGRFVDGLEFQGSLPEPSALILLATGLISVAGGHVSRRSRARSAAPPKA